ncbi:MAG TPA: lysoplasmalogenase [Burkholderiaceae bacterium]|nr:lysoplasmalogenase [Burkholderiaceae bacterium]
MPARLYLLLPVLAVLGALLAIAGNMLPAPMLVYLFKPATTLLVIAWAWPRGADVPDVRRWILIGLWWSLAGDIFLMWPRQGFLPGLVSFLLAHLAFIVAFTRRVPLVARSQPFALYALVAAVLLAQLWPGVPAALRWPVLAYVVCLATMAAQAGVVWLVARGGPGEALARNAAIGGVLFMASDALLAFNKFNAPIPLSALLILATYWAALLLIAASLRAPPPGRR